MQAIKETGSSIATVVHQRIRNDEYVPLVTDAIGISMLAVGLLCSSVEILDYADRAYQQGTIHPDMTPRTYQEVLTQGMSKQLVIEGGKRAIPTISLALAYTIYSIL